MKLFALCANSVKNHLMARDIVPAGQQCLPVQLRIVGKVQVVNRSALVTAEMRVGHCLCVIAAPPEMPSGGLHLHLPKGLDSGKRFPGSGWDWAGFSH